MPRLSVPAGRNAADRARRAVAKQGVQVTDRVVELPRPASSTPGFERTPPQDIPAEQSVVGGMLLSKDAVADVVEVVRSTDFYRPAHQSIFDVIVDLYGRGDPTDVIAVSDELTRIGDIARIGGAPYLHTLMSSVPTAASAGYYARIVAERAVLRRLVEAGTRIVQLGYATGGGEVDDVVDRAQQAVYDVTERRTSEDYALLEDLMQPTMDELEAIGSRGGSMTGVPTGFADLDTLTNGLHPGQLIVIAGRPGLGKALALDTPLATPTGWTTMGEVAVGEQLLGADGRLTTVLAATEVLLGRPCFEVAFCDGSRIVADAEHQWVTQTTVIQTPVIQTVIQTRAGHRSAPGRAGVRTTRELAATLRDGTAGRPLDHWVGAAPALQLPARELPVPPYVLGVWLGAGDSAGIDLTTADPELVLRLEAEGLVVAGRTGERDELLLPGGRPVQAAMKTLGVLGSRHVPAGYLRGSLSQRRALLAGLMDARGTVTPAGDVQLRVPPGPLTRDVRELVTGLGHRCRVTGRRGEGGSRDWLLRWDADGQEVFRLEGSKLLHKERRGAREPRDGRRLVTAVTPVPSVPVRCVQVDSSDHLYLAGRQLVPTHNSTLGLDIARSASVKNSQASVIFSLEMTKTEITMRLLSAEARVPLHHMRSGTMTDDDWARLARRMGEVAEAPLYIDDSPNLTMMEIRAKARRLKQRKQLRLVVIDYLQLMTGNKRAESRQQEVSELSRSLKLLAKELEVPVIAMSQLNRGAEQRTDKKPMLADLRESGCLPASTRVLRADTGAEVTLGELHAAGAREVPVWSLDSSLRYVRRHLTHVFATGTREVLRLRLASGRSVRATANHPFLTYEGWRPLVELAPGVRLAVPRHVPAPELQAAWSDEQVLEHARRTADVGHQQPELARAVSALPKRQIRMFVRLLWQERGSLGLEDPCGPAVLRAGEELLREVSLLLLRFGISARLWPGGGALAVVEPDDRRRLLSEIAVAVPHEAPFCPLARGNADSVPQHVWQHVRQRTRSALDERQPVSAAVRAEPLAALAGVLDDAGLALEETNDVRWDEVVEITPDGVEQVFDATVVGTHNFVADGIAVHNSIEQDADMVVLLHREDAYEKESPRAGEADFIVAKHRNGPTQTITVAFQGHYSRFVDMSPS